MDVAFRDFGFLKLSMQRALLGNVPLNLAGVRAELSENIVVVSAYFFDKPSEKDIEHIEVAATEVIADFPEGYTLKTVFGLRGEIANEKSGWCFLRTEGLSAPRPSIVRSQLKSISNDSPLRLGILLSGRGSNFLAIARSIREGRLPGVEIAIVISNVAAAEGIQKARELDLPIAVYVSAGVKREHHDFNVAACLALHNVDLVCLAGYMRLLSPGFIAAFPNRILNIHPSLLPAFPGLDAQQQAFDYGVKVAGCTVHFVDEHLDHGAIILQRAIPVLDTDDAHSLADRILVEEHIAYTEALVRVASGHYEIRGRRYVSRNA